MVLAPEELQADRMEGRLQPKRTRMSTPHRSELTYSPHVKRNSFPPATTLHLILFTNTFFSPLLESYHSTSVLSF